METLSEQVKEVLKSLVNEYGADRVESVVKELLGLSRTKTNIMDYAQSITPDKILDSINDLGSCAVQIVQTGRELPGLLKQKGDLEARISAAENEAFMAAETDGKNIVITVRSGDSLTLSNKELRDQWVSSLAASDRADLLRVKGEIDALQSEQKRVEAAAQTVRARADIQASLLRYLAG